MLNFKEVNKARFFNSFNLHVRPDQLSYVCKDLEDFVHNWKCDENFDCYLIEDANHAIGFFAMDFSFPRHNAYLGEIANFGVLRSFFIDQRFQGRGFASEALSKLDKFFKERYPRLRNIILTVNFKNEVAINFYEKVGFKKLHEPFLGGSAGPQYVMVKSI